MITNVKKGQKIWFRDLGHTMARMGKVGADVTIVKKNDINDHITIDTKGIQGLKPEDQITITLGRGHYAEVEAEDMFVSRTETIESLAESSLDRVQEELDFMLHLLDEIKNLKFTKDIKQPKRSSKNNHMHWQTEIE